MTTDTDTIQQNPMDRRYENLAQRYDSLSKKLQIQSEIDQKKHEQLMETMKITNEKILKTASDLAYHPQVETSEPNIDPSERRRARKRERERESQQDLYAENRYWLATKHGI